jgi:uncharacterized lipoprotein YmbA
MSAAPVRSSSSCRRSEARNTLRRPLAAWLLALVCAGCAAPPAVHFHSLVLPTHPAPKEGLAPTGRGPAIVLDPIRIPVAVDQPQWLLRMPDDTLTLLEQERWASPLRDEFRQALMEILRHRYGAVDVRAIGSGATPWRLHVTITRFELQPGEAWLESVWSLGQRNAETPALRCRSSFTETSVGGMPALAQAQRRAVEKLGDAIGEQLLALNNGQAGRCPT